MSSNTEIQSPKKQGQTDHNTVIDSKRNVERKREKRRKKTLGQTYKTELEERKGARIKQKNHYYLAMFPIYKPKCNKVPTLKNKKTSSNGNTLMGQKHLMFF